MKLININASFKLENEDKAEIKELNSGVIYYSYSDGCFYTVEEDNGDNIDCYVCELVAE